MADYVASVEGRFDNQVSAGADAATASMNRAADAADKATVSFTKAGPSATALAAKYDDVTKANKALGAAVRDQTAAQAALQRAQATGVGDAEALSRAYDAVSAKVARLRGEVRAAITDAAEGPDTFRKVGSAMEEAGGHAAKFGELNHNITREFIVLGHEALMGNFSRIPGTFMVLAENAQGVLPTLGTIASGFASIGVVGAAAGVAAVAGLGLMAYHAAEADAQLLRLQNRLRGTRDDWQAASGEIMTGSRAFSESTGVSRGTSRQAAQAIVSVPEFAGSTADLQHELVIARDLAGVMGTTLPEAAQVLAQALHDPAAAAKKAEEEGLRGFNSALVESVRHMQASGDIAGAQARVLQAYDDSVGGAADHTTELGRATKELGDAWRALTGPVGELTESIGHGLVSVLTEFVHLSAQAVQGAAALERVALNTGTPAGASGFVGSGEPLPASTQGLMPTIDAISRRTGLDPTLLARLQAFENPHQNPDGSWPTSPTGAIGAFQVLPSTFALMRNKPSEYPLTAATDGNLSNTATNATAAGELMKHLLDKYHDPYTAILAYHDGEPIVDALLKNGQDAGNAYASPAAVKEANIVTAGYLGTGFALQSTFGNSTHAERLVNPGAQGQSASQSGQDRANLLNAQSVADKANTLEAQRRANEEQQAALQKGIGIASANGDAQTVAELTTALAKLRGEETGLISEQAKLARSAAETTAVYASQSPVLRDLIAVRQKFEDAARASGQGVDESAALIAQEAELRKLVDQHDQAVAAVDRDTAAQHVLATAYDTFGGSVQHVQDLLKATEDVRQTSIPGSVEEKRQIEATTAALDANAVARADVQTAQQNQTSGQTIEMLKAEIAAVGQSTAAWQIEIAALKERQAIVSRGGDPSSGISQQAIGNAEEVARLTAELERQKASMAALGQIGEQVFNDLGQSISQAFVSGQGHAVTFKSVVESVLADVQTQLIKLALVNPLENRLTDSHNQTASGLMSALTGGASSSGVLGGLLGLINSGDSAGGSSLLDSGNTGWVNLDGTTSTGSGLSTLIGTGAGVLGGLGALFSASQAGDNTTGSNKTDTRIGAYAGAAIGTAILPGVGSIVGEMLGQVIGSMFGSVQHNGWNIKIGTTPEGMLTTTNSGFEGTSKDNSAQALAQAAYDEARVNQLLTEYNAKASGSTLYGGDNGAGGVNLVGQATTFEEAMGKLVYSSTDAIIEQALQTYGAAGTLNSINNLATVLANAKSLSDAATNLSSPIATSGAGNFLTDNYTGLGGSIAQQSASLWNSAYAPQLNEASVIGNKDLYNQLLAGFNQIVQKLYDEASYQTQQTSYGYTAATQTANGQTFAAQNTQFTASSAQQQEALKQQLDGLYGTAYESTQGYADMFAQLNTSLDAQAQALARQQQRQLTSDLVGLQATNLGYQSDAATSGGQTDLAAQLGLQASQITTMNQAINSLTGLLENGEISQSDYNRSLSLLSDAQNAQTAALVKQQTEADQQARDTYQANTLTYEARTLTAQGSNSEAAALANFDASAIQQQDSLKSQLETMLENGVISTEQYYGQITDLDKTLAAERLAVQQQYVDAANSQITSQVTSLKGFLQGLEGDLGTPADQLKNTQATFEADLKAALGGDSTALGNLQSDASSFLSASKEANGAGTTAYSDSLTEVINGIKSLTDSQSVLDSLTASTMAQISETQTQKLTDALSQVKAEIAKLVLQQQQATLAP